jgi:hypothetical protein
MRLKCREFGGLVAIERLKQINADLCEFKTSSMRINVFIVPQMEDGYPKNGQYIYNTHV